MARWTVAPGGVGNTMKGQIDYHDDDSHEWKLYQDEKPFLEQAKLDRENSLNRKKDVGYKKFATIPEIVAIEIKDKHGIDLHDHTFMDDIDKKAKFMTIIKQDYSQLMSY